ncbi:MAG: neuromedin U [Candidatus Eremiobacteraeota bacterium]|nr:neuromedin U [Candidatus Eremiobacteraeota bacterium]
MNKLLAGLVIFALMMPSMALGQTAPSPSPEAPAPQASLTPQQQAAVQQYIIKLSQNPVGNITILPFQFNNNYAIGLYARYQFNMNFQPVVPIMLSRHLSLIARTIIPVLYNPSNMSPGLCPPNGQCGGTFGISDIQEQLFFAPKTKPGEFVWGAGPIFQFPTATPQSLGTGQWSAGPAVVGLVLPGPWVIGMLATQLWSFTGRAGAPSVDSGLFQPFVNYNLKGGWSLTTAPIITVNYTAPGNQKWAVPIGGGGGKTFKIGDQTMQINMFYYTFIQRPITSPQTNLRIVWSLLYPVKRGFNIQDALQAAGVK